AVLVGAGTVRVDDPQLTVRPAHRRARPYRRIVACETGAIASASRVLQPAEGYESTMVLAPGGSREKFVELEERTDVVYVGDGTVLDLREALRAIRERGITSVLCEGGPTLASRLVEKGLVERFYWLLAPLLLNAPQAVPALTAAARAQSLRFDGVERLGEDVMVTGRFDV
ncbi:MAG: dihydrofolate reductase family protein, partial [Candidatus Eremiobacteraeota bacterium]|nr:dihydrofolate reductase family protein [Candidatus Eremiobacteraeota bacterium]